jgi:flagellar hook-associated protein 3 FlgL
MRVTNNSFPNYLVGQLGKLNSRQAQLQTQAATGQKVSRPEDNPAAFRRILDHQAEGAAQGQYRSNILRLREHSQVSYESMKALKKVSDRAGEIAVLADGTRSGDELRIYADEVTQLIEQAVQLANTQYQGAYLFAGTKSDQTPFVLTRTPAGQIDAVTYQGNSAVSEVEIAAGVTLSTQVPGANSTGAGPAGLLSDSRSGADLFGHLISLRKNLLAGDRAAIQNNSLPELQRDEDHFLTQFGALGTTQARLETTEATSLSQTQTLDELISHEADADLAQTLIQLQATQTAYQAALQSGASILNRSLLDFLR